MKTDVVVIGAGAAGRGNSSHALEIYKFLEYQQNTTGNKFGRFCLYGK